MKINTPRNLGLFRYILIYLLPFQLLFGESYSSYRLDDFLIIGGGIRKFEEGPRVKKNKSNFYYDLDLYLTGDYRSLGGGLESDDTSFYLGRGNLSPEAFIQYSNDKIRTFFLVSGQIGASEYRLFEREVSTLKDSEFLGGISIYEKLFFQGGRGFQRLDRLGFLFNSFMNFANVGYSFSHDGIRMELQGLSGNANDPDRNLSPEIWKSGRTDWNGFQFVGYIEKWKLDWNAVYFQKSQNLKYSYPDDPLQAPAKDIYTGLEWGFEPFHNFHLDMGGFSKSGYSDLYSPLINRNEPKEFRNSNLYYLQITKSIENFHLRGNGIWETGDGWFLERDIGVGYKNANPRFMGGEGSILLNLRNNPVFLPLDFSKNTKISGGGFELGYSLIDSHNNRIGLSFLGNSLTSYFGRGTEGIIQFSIVGNKQNFLLFSFAYGETNPKRKTGFIIDENLEDIPIRAYRKFFISGGISF